MSSDVVTIDGHTGEVLPSERGADGPLALTVEETVRFLRQVHEAKERILVEGKGGDYWVIPGTGSKPSLLKPGAEKLLHFFGYRVAAMTRTETQTNPLGFAYECRIENRAGQTVAVCEGWCDNGESGRGKSSRNATMKMAQKRALVGAVLNACAASGLFTQDMEDEVPTEGLPSAPSAPGGAVAAPPARGRTGDAPAPGPQRSSSPSGSAGAAGSAMEVSHPEHRLHELWRILDALGIEWKPANYMRAIEVLKREGIENVDALRDDLTHARAKALVRIAFGVKLEPEGEPAEAVLNPPDFPAAVNDHPAEGLHAKSFTQETDGTVTAMYAIPSAKEKPGEHWRAHLSNGGGHICECPARKVPCRHITEALELLREDAERDGWVMRRFAVLLGLEEPAEDAVGEGEPEKPGSTE